MHSIETVIIGAGQAGLSLSYCLTQKGLEHVILEKSPHVGSAWHSRWDSFTLVTPNWQIGLPGMEYQGPDPDGFMPRDEFVDYLERYTQQNKLPVRFGLEVHSVEATEGGYRVETSVGAMQTRNVVMATGMFQQPRIPPASHAFPTEIQQMHSGQYQNPASLSPGAVLVVGTAQSGCQIAEELYQSGRTVYLSVGSTGRVPRRYRGKDSTHWLNALGFFDRTPDKLPSPKAKFASQPHVSGKSGGRTLNLHRFAREGVVLLGRIKGVEEGKLHLEADLKTQLQKVDQFEAQVLKMIDGYIERAGLEAPPETLLNLQDGYEVEEVLELDLRRVGITNVIWATGYRFDYSLVKLPVTDGDGYPVQQRGVTEFSGLYFLGMPWLHKMKSGLLLGIGEDAAFIAEHIAARG